MPACLLGSACSGAKASALKLWALRSAGTALLAGLGAFGYYVLGTGGRVLAPSSRAAASAAPKQVLAARPPTKSVIEHVSPIELPSNSGDNAVVRPAPAMDVAKGVKPAHSASSPDLSGELALLDAASRATSAGDTALAQRLLERYDRQHERGSLRLEAAALRVEALAAAGRTAEAAARARALVAQHPQSPIAQRMRRFVGRGPADKSLK